MKQERSRKVNTLPCFFRKRLVLLFWNHLLLFKEDKFSHRILLLFRFFIERMCFFQKKTFATCMHPVLRPLTAEKNVNKGNALSCVVQLPLRLDCILIKQKHFQSLFQAIASETLHETTSWSTCKLKKRECPSNRVKGSSVFFST